MMDMLLIAAPLIGVGIAFYLFDVAHDYEMKRQSEERDERIRREIEQGRAR